MELQAGEGPLSPFVNDQLRAPIIHRGPMQIEVNMMNNDQMTPADLALEEEEIQMLLGQ